MGQYIMTLFPSLRGGCLEPLQRRKPDVAISNHFDRAMISAAYARILTSSMLGLGDHISRLLRPASLPFGFLAMTKYGEACLPYERRRAGVIFERQLAQR